MDFVAFLFDEVIKLMTFEFSIFDFKMSFFSISVFTIILSILVTVLCKLLD